MNDFLTISVPYPVYAALFAYIMVSTILAITGVSCAIIGTIRRR